MDKLNLTDSLKKLEGINDWFENQEEVDVETGLEKVKEGIELVKASQFRLKEIQNEFEEVKKDIKQDLKPEQVATRPEDNTVNIDEIPF